MISLSFALFLLLLTYIPCMFAMPLVCYTYTCSGTHTCSHIHMFTCTHAHTHMYTCSHIHIPECTHAHMGTCSHMHIPAYIYIPVYGIVSAKRDLTHTL